MSLCRLVTRATFTPGAELELVAGDGGPDDHADQAGLARRARRARPRGPGRAPRRPWCRRVRLPDTDEQLDRRQPPRGALGGRTEAHLELLALVGRTASARPRRPRAASASRRLASCGRASASAGASASWSYRSTRSRRIRRAPRSGRPSAPEVEQVREPLGQPHGRAGEVDRRRPAGPSAAGTSPLMRLDRHDARAAPARRTRPSDRAPVPAPPRHRTEQPAAVARTRRRRRRRWCAARRRAGRAMPADDASTPQHHPGARRPAGLRWQPARRCRRPRRLASRSMSALAGAADQQHATDGERRRAPGTDSPPSSGCDDRADGLADRAGGVGVRRSRPPRPTR